MSPRNIRLDPREVYPQLAYTMDDREVEAWNDDPHCLCGCGSPTSRDRTGKGLVPIGAPHLWAPGHASRAPWYMAAITRLTPEQEARRRMRSNDSIESAVISMMLEEYMRTHSLARLSQRTEVPASLLSMLAGYRRKRLRKETAARILVGLGEPLRPEIAAAYSAWKRRRHGRARTG